MQSKKITNREQEILLLALDGLSNVEIAVNLNISHRTVETHKARALRKMGVRSVFSLMNGGPILGNRPPTDTAQAFQDTPCGYHSLAADYTIREMNNIELSWLGYERSEIIGKIKFQDILTQSSRKLFDLIFPIFTRTGKLTDLSLDVLTKDNITLNFLVNATVVRDQGGHYLFSHSFVANLSIDGATQDRETTLKRTQELHSKILTDQTEVISRFKADGTFVFINEVYALFFGIQLHEIMGEKWNPVAFPEDIPYIEERLKELSQSSPVITIENRVFDYMGCIRWMQFVNRAFFDKNGQISEIQSVGRDITDRKLLEAEIHRLAYYDHLTNLPNRRLFWDTLNDQILHAQKEQTAIAVCFVDLDGFKPINDNWGHRIGDRVLQEVGNRLASVIRTHDSIARFGGDEYVLLLNEVDSQAECDTILDRVIKAIYEPMIFVTDKTIRITSSIGVAMFPHDARDSEELLRLSDIAMYEAKRMGGNTVHYVTTGIKRSAVERN